MRVERKTIDDVPASLNARGVAQAKGQPGGAELHSRAARDGDRLNETGGRAAVNWGV